MHYVSRSLEKQGTCKAQTPPPQFFCGAHHLIRQHEVASVPLLKGASSFPALLPQVLVSGCSAGQNLRSCLQQFLTVTTTSFHTLLRKEIKQMKKIRKTAN